MKTMKGHEDKINNKPPSVSMYFFMFFTHCSWFNLFYQSLLKAYCLRL